MYSSVAEGAASTMYSSVAEGAVLGLGLGLDLGSGFDGLRLDDTSGALCQVVVLNILRFLRGSPGEG